MIFVYSAHAYALVSWYGDAFEHCKNVFTLTREIALHFLLGKEILTKENTLERNTLET